MQKTTNRPLSVIGMEIIVDINLQYKGKTRPSWLAYASPYLMPLLELEDIEDNYYADSARTIVSYLLGNLTNWRGDTARAIKAELKGMLK